MCTRYYLFGVNYKHILDASLLVVVGCKILNGARNILVLL